MKDGWEVIRSSHPRTSWYKWVWDPALPPQISTFTWRALHGRTPTDCLAKSRGIRLPSRCYICQQEERNLKLIYSIVARSRLRYGLFILNGLVYLDYLMAISLSVLRVGDAPYIKIREGSLHYFILLYCVGNLEFKKESQISVIKTQPGMFPCSSPCYLFGYKQKALS